MKKKKKNREVYLFTLNDITACCSISQDGGTPLFVACQCNHLDVVKELLDRGADIHAQMVDGATPLFITAQNGHHELLKFLLKKGADVDIQRKVSLVILELKLTIHLDLI